MIVYDVHSLYKTYPGQQTPANKAIDLQIRQSEIFGILGDNGAGKTTLVRQMVNLIRPSSGRIELFGQSVSADPLQVPLNVTLNGSDGNMNRASGILTAARPNKTQSAASTAIGSHIAMSTSPCVVDRLLAAGWPRKTAWMSFMKLASVSADPNIAAASQRTQSLLPAPPSCMIPW